MSLEVDALVRKAGVEVGLNAEDPLLDKVCANLKEQLIVKEWQLGLLDSSQWNAVGAPIGLAVAVGSLSSKQQGVGGWKNPRPSSETRFSSGLTTRSSVAVNSSRSGDNRNNNNLKSKPKVGPSLFNRFEQAELKAQGALSSDDEDLEIKEEEEIEFKPGESENTNNTSTETSDTAQKTGVATCFRDLVKVNMPVDMVCFSMTGAFDQALIHSKSGEELKAHTMFVTELSVVASALFLGAAIELWGVFPMDMVRSEPAFLDGLASNGAGIPQGLAIAFNVTTTLLIISQLLCAAGWIWSLRVIAAISSTKFHEYANETRHFCVHLRNLSVLGITLFTLDIFLLFVGMSMTVTNDWVVNGLVLAFVLSVFFMGSMACHKITSYFARVAYHGMLLMDECPQKPEKEGFTNKREHKLHKKFISNCIFNPKEALDAYSLNCDLNCCG